MFGSDKAAPPAKLVLQILQYRYWETRLCRGVLTVLAHGIGPSDLDLQHLRSSIRRIGLAARIYRTPPRDHAHKGYSLIRYPGEAGVALQHLGAIVRREASFGVRPNISAWLAAHH